MSGYHFAVASTFSPRHRAVIAEADRVARKFDARLSILHADDRSDDKVVRFQTAFAELGRDEVDIYWCSGQNASEALIDAAASEYFDLVIAGAMERPSDFRNFTGAVARELLQCAPCDLLLIPSPEEEEVEDCHACLLIEAHRPRWQAASRTLAALAPKSISVLAADSPFARARDAAMGHASDDSELLAMEEALQAISPDVEIRTVQSNTGFPLCDIVQDAQPDFLIVEAEWKNRRRYLPTHLDWLNQVIPARLFLLGKPPAQEFPYTLREHAEPSV